MNGHLIEKEEARSEKMADVDRVTEVVTALIKAKKNLHMYPVHHPVYEKTIDDFSLKMFSLLEGDTVTIRINQYDILFDDEIIYHNRDKEESLALFFFKDGIRELSFLSGITRSEIREFLEIIALDFEKEVLDDDIVTLLWEKELEHVRYIVDDTFLAEDDVYEKAAVNQARSTAGGHDNVMKAYENSRHRGVKPDVDIIALTNDDIQGIIREIENDSPDKTDVLISMLFEMLHLAKEKSEYEAIAASLRDILYHALTGADIDIVNLVLKTVKGGPDRVVYSAEAGDALARVERYINSESFIRAFGELVSTGADIPGASIEEFSSYLHVSSIPHFISILGKLEDMSSRRAIINILIETGKRDVAAVAAGLNDRKWYVVRNIVYVLRQIGESSAVEYLVRSAGHKDKRVRKEVVRALGEFGTDDVIPVLEERLSDEAEQVRITASMAVGRIGTQLSKSVILKHISSKGFRDKGYAEKKEVFKVLCRWKEKDITDMLLKTVKKWTVLKRTKNNETRAAAVHCLGLLGTGSARQIIEKLTTSKNRLLRTQAIEALRKH